MRPDLRGWLPTLLSVAVLLGASECFASSTEVGGAGDDSVTLGYRALEAFRIRDFLSAAEGFQAAEERAHSPVFVLYRALALRELNRFGEARGLLESVALEDLASSAPISWRDAKQRARAELVLLRRDMPEVVVRLPDTTTFPVRIVVMTFESDRVQVHTATAGSFRFAVDPGVHEVTVSDAAGRSVSSKARQVERGSVFEFYVSWPSVPAASAEKTSPSPGADPPVEPDWTIRRIVTVGSLVTAGTAVVAGAAFGIAALLTAEQLDGRCNSGRCDPADEAIAEDARRYARVANVAFIAAGGSAAVGVTLLLLPSEATPTQRQGGLTMGLSVTGVF